MHCPAWDDDFVSSCYLRRICGTSAQIIVQITVILLDTVSQPSNLLILGSKVKGQDRVRVRVRESATIYISRDCTYLLVIVINGPPFTVPVVVHVDAETPRCAATAMTMEPGAQINLTCSMSFSGNSSPEMRWFAGGGEQLTSVDNSEPRTVQRDVINWTLTTTRSREDCPA